MNQTTLPSNRSFGALFVVVFLLMGSYLRLRGSEAYAWWLALSAVMAIVTVVDPGRLAPLNRAWMHFARILNTIVSPIMLGTMFYFVFTPVAVVMRLAGRDAMKRHFDPHVRTYWEDRTPPGPDPSGLPYQF